MKKILITGGAGFIGANFIRFVIENSLDISVLNLDKLSYAGDVGRLEGVDLGDRYEFIRADVCDKKAVDKAFSEGLDAVVHFAAESHVDRSIEDALPFEITNVRGTLTLLEAARRHGIGKFIHISTDEVYGELGEEGSFSEDAPLAPNSPYSASKASADHFVQAFHRTYGLPSIIVRPTNNYGPWQFPEKLIPVVIGRALENKSIPVYADGLNVREWLYVTDCAEGIYSVLLNGRPGEVYNLGSGVEKTNIEVVKAILSLLERPESLIEFVADRPGHDFRYSLNSAKIKHELGFHASTGFDEGIEKTVKWYLDNKAWWHGLV